MEQVGRSMLNQLRVNHKPKKSTDGQDQEMSISKPVITRSHSARGAEAFRTKQATPTTLMMRQNKSCRYPLTHQDITGGNDQIVNNSVTSSIIKSNLNNNNKSQQAAWDCGSSLYDSFELNSLNLQLDMAIRCSSSRRTGGLSIPPADHSDHNTNNNPISSSPVVTKNYNLLLVPNNKIKSGSRPVIKSLNKILRSVFGSSKATVKYKTDTSSPYNKVVKTSSSCSSESGRKGGLYNIITYGSKSMRVLTTIQEIQDIDHEHHPKFSPADESTPTVLTESSVRR